MHGLVKLLPSHMWGFELHLSAGSAEGAVASNLRWKTKLRLTQVFFQGKTKWLAQSVLFKGVLPFRSSPHFPMLAIYRGGGAVSPLSSMSHNCLSWNKCCIVGTLRAGNRGGAGLRMLCHPVLLNSIFLAIVESLLSGVLWKGVSSPHHLLSHTESTLCRQRWNDIFSYRKMIGMEGHSDSFGNLGGGKQRGSLINSLPGFLKHRQAMICKLRGGWEMTGTDNLTDINTATCPVAIYKPVGCTVAGKWKSSIIRSSDPETEADVA